MKIRSLQIRGLFDIFDYDIPLDGSKPLTIITGPNGYGKTMILKIIFNLLTNNLEFFQRLIFSEIRVWMDEDVQIRVLAAGKHPEMNGNEDGPVFILERAEEVIEQFHHGYSQLDKLASKAEAHLPISRLDRERWLDHRTREVLNISDVLLRARRSGLAVPELFETSTYRPTHPQFDELLKSIDVHLIREQRLLKVSEERANTFRDSDIPMMTDAIQSYAEELKVLISEYVKSSFNQTQELDSSYPMRLRLETEILAQHEYTERFTQLKIRRKKLTEFGLYESKQEIMAFSQEDAKALSVYIKDLEKKLSVFDELLEKLELFTDILNERRFTFKSIKISRENGFHFVTNLGKNLSLRDLSSGEQHEVVLLYELIFKVKQNVLVLIDEPEISLHIAWQKEFLKDLLRIAKIRRGQFIVATHSPAIINDRWDLVYNLEKTSRTNEEIGHNVRG